MTTTPNIQPDDALILVDVQNDFCPGGALAVAEGDRIVPILNRWVDAAETAGATIAASRDWHPPGDCSFKEQGGPWPVHCIQKSDGARFHPQLRLPEQTIIISKGQNPDFDQYSAFDRTDLADRLKDRGVHRIWVGGLAQDVCVRATVLDGIKAGFDVHLIKTATRPVDPEKGQEALAEMRDAGAIIQETNTEDD